MTPKSNCIVRSLEHILMMTWRVEPTFVGSSGCSGSHVDVFATRFGAFIGGPIPGSLLPSDGRLVSKELVLIHIFGMASAGTAKL